MKDYGDEQKRLRDNNRARYSKPFQYSECIMYEESSGVKYD